MKKKRPSLAEFGQETARAPKPKGGKMAASVEMAIKSVHKSVYLPPAVLDQLDLLAIQERPQPGRKKKFNSLVIEGLDLLFKSRGLKSVADLTGSDED